MYEVKTQVVGYLEQEEVKTVDMPRERFLAIVQDTIDAMHYSDDAKEFVRNEIAPVAKSIKWFPFHTWYVAKRGCGCLIGEYLIASPELKSLPLLDAKEREENIEQLESTGAVGDYVQTESVRVALYERIDDGALADAMISFGYDINLRLSREVGTLDLRETVLTIVD